MFARVDPAYRLTPTQSSRQAAALAFIRQYIARTGMSPSYGEIAAALGITTGLIGSVVRGLVAKGLLVRGAGKERNLALPDQTRLLARADALAALEADGWIIVGDRLQLVAPSPIQPLPRLPILPQIVGDGGGDCDGPEHS